MIWRTGIFMLACGPAFAVGPLFQHKDGFVDQEFRNVYHDLQYPIISTGTATNFTVTKLNGSTYTPSKVVQIRNMATSTLFSTTATGFTSTNTTLDITPTSASNKILVLVSGQLRYTSASVGLSAYWTLDRSGTNLGDATNGMGRIQSLIGSASGDTELLVAMAYLDSPATTSSRTYTIQIRVAASGIVYFPNSATCSMTLLEVVP